MSELGNKKIMSNNLKYYMELNNKDRNQICKDLGLRYSTFTDWVNGNVYPRIDKIEMLANYFGINKSDLVEEKEHNEMTEDLIILNRAAKNMTPENRKKLINIAEILFKEDFSKDD